MPKVEIMEEGLDRASNLYHLESVGFREPEHFEQVLNRHGLEYKGFTESEKDGKVIRHYVFADKEWKETIVTSKNPLTDQGKTKSENSEPDGICRHVQIYAQDHYHSALLFADLVSSAWYCKGLSGKETKGIDENYLHESEVINDDL